MIASSGGRAVSSVYGQIQELAIAMKGEIDPETVAHHYSKFLQSFSHRTEVVVLGKFAGDFLASLPNPYNRSIRKVIGGHKVLLVDALQYKSNAQDNTRWIEDPFIVLGMSGNRIALLEPFDSRQMQMAGQLSNAYGAFIKSTDLKLEGGNMLVGDDYVLIGKDQLLANLELIGVESGETFYSLKENLEERLRELLGMERIIWVGNSSCLRNTLEFPGPEFSWQPLFHLDMFLTLGGRSSAQDYQGDEMIFVAELKLDPDELCNYVQGDLGDEEEDRRWVSLRLFRDRLNEVASFFEDHHDQYPGPRFHVERFPIQIELKRNHPTVIYSFNNCLVEWYDGFRRIYLPQYDIGEDCEKIKDKAPSLQCWTQQLLSDLGYRVTWVDGSFRSYAKDNGALNCMAKVLKRGQS